MENIIEWKSPISGKILLLRENHLGCDACCFVNTTEHNSHCSSYSYHTEKFPNCDGKMFMLVGIKEDIKSQYEEVKKGIRSRMKLIKDEMPEPDVDCLIFKNNGGFSVATMENKCWWRRKPSSKSNVKVLDNDLWIYIENL